MNKSVKNIALVLIIGVIILAIYKLGDFNKQNAESLQYSDFMKKVYDKKVRAVTITGGTKIKGQYLKGENAYVFETIIPYSDPDLIKTLIANNVEIEGEEADSNVLWRGILSFLPWLFIIGIFWFVIMRQLQATGSRAMSFGKSRAKMSPETKNKVTFKDVAGVDEAKEELGEVIDFLKDPKKFSGIGAKIPKGVLLVGSPGTGKTLLAKAIAGEADVPFFSISGSDFVEMFVGVGASRVRDLFDQGKKNAPCIIFIDEIDAVGRLRGAGVGGGHDEREQTLNQLLVEMDGFETNEGVIIIAATNRPDILDPALLRPGRFDRQVVVDTPDVRGREKILAVHSRKIPLAREVDLKVIARGTPGFTGADLANLVNEAALLTARKNRKRVSMLEMEEAKDKVMMGPERRSLLLSDEEKEITAYHEAGHAILGWLLPGYDPVHKVTIIPRGRALGLTMNLPKEDKHSYAKSYILNKIIQSYGGLLVEKMQFNEMTTGSSNDIEVATSFARKMVCEWGMSDNLGSLTFGKNNEQIFLGREISQHRDYSEATAEDIDREVKRILGECEEKARKLLTENKDKYQKMAKYLIERETLTGEEIGMIMNGEELPPLPVPDKTKSSEKTAGSNVNQPDPVKDKNLRPAES